MNSPGSKNQQTRKIRVLFVIVNMKMGGSEHLVLELIRTLDRNRFEPYLAWFYVEKPLQQFVELDIPLFHIPKVRRFDFKTMRDLAGIIKKNGIDIVNAHHFLSLVYTFYGSKVAGKAGLLYTEHSAWELQVISTKWRQMGKLLLRFSDGVIGISDKVSTALATTFRLPAEKVHTIPNGVDCTLYSPLPHETGERKKVGFSDNDTLIGIVANLKKNKNHIFLLQAFNALQKYHKHLKLILIGAAFEDDPESSERELHDYIKKNSLQTQVKLLGSQPDIPGLLRTLDIFCLVSYEEGLPISLIEAMATGLPVIGTDVEGIRDVIDHGVNGYLVELNNLEQLTDSLQKLVEDPPTRLRFGKKSREMALKKYAFDRCIGKYTRLFERFSRIAR